MLGANVFEQSPTYDLRFGSKNALYRVIHEEMERRMTARMEGAAGAVGAPGREAVGAALRVAYDAAVRFRVARLLSEPPLDPSNDPIAATLELIAPPVAPVLAAAWRGGALAATAGGLPAETAREGLVWAWAATNRGGSGDCRRTRATDTRCRGRSGSSRRAGSSRPPPAAGRDGSTRARASR